jgi:hypothetical protein
MAHTKQTARASSSWSKRRAVPDPEEDSEADSEATIATEITSEDILRISRECDESNRQRVHGQGTFFCRRAIALTLTVNIDLQDSARPPHEINHHVALGKRGISDNQIAQQRNNEQRKRKRLCEEDSFIGFEEPNRNSTNLASTKTRKSRTGMPGPDETNRRVEKLVDVKQDNEGNIEVKICWVDWMPMQKLRGKEAHKAAKELVIRKFGEGVWTAASESWSAVETSGEEP